MENATKALLIAAAVLIAIVLVALGVRLLNAAGDTSGDAQNVSSQLKNSTGEAANGLVNSMSNLNVTF